MQINKGNLFYSTLTFVVAFAVLTFFYHTVLFAPNDYLFAPSGDGIQNYYSYLFHAKYDAQFWEFSGMNYPFGEHAVYAGAQPLLSWLIGTFGLTDYGIGILNFLMLMSFPICAVFLFKIFRHFQLPNNLALISAIAVTFMSPQIFRLTGHLSLTPVFFIPLMWWLLIKSNQTNALKWSIFIALYILWIFFTHPYLGLILLFFGFFFWSISTVANKKDWKKYLLNIALQLMIPFVLFQVLVIWSDSYAAERLGTPAGFFDFYANWKSVFVAHHGPMNYLTVLSGVDIGNWESWNYVGLSTAVFASFILVHVIKNRKSFAFKEHITAELSLFMITGYLILIFSFCFPLKYDFLRGLVDYLGPLKQFRVLGRFSWIFFYIFIVFCIVNFYKLVQKKNGSLALKAVLIGGLVFYAVEFYAAHNDTSKIVALTKNQFQKENVNPDLIELANFVESEKYDAFIFLPFNHLSSENIMRLGTEQGNFESFLLSYHTGKPMFNAIVSRMSMKQAILMNNFFSPEFVEKELLNYIEVDAKILVVKNMEGIKNEELRLVWCSDKVFENASFKAFNFNREKWNTDFYFNEIVAKNDLANIQLADGWRSDTNKVWFYYNSYNDQKGESFAGQGALRDIKTGFNIIESLDKEQLEVGDYTINFWYYLGVDRPDVTAVVEEIYNDESKNNWSSTYAVSQSNLIVNNWCFVTLDFNVASDLNKINILISGNGNKQPFYIDELLIRKQNGPHLFMEQEVNGIEYIVYDNYWLRADSFKSSKK